MYLKSNTQTQVYERDVVHMFFTLLFQSTDVRCNKSEAYNLIINILEQATEAANKHNKKISGFNSKHIDMHLDSCEDWKELLYDTTIPQNSPRSVYATVTTHQYLLIGANGSIEIHQAIDEVYLKVEPELYRKNKYESLILSMPGFDAKDVWGNETPAREYFSKNNKTGLVYRKTKYV